MKNILSKILLTSLVLFLLVSCVSCKSCNKNKPCEKHIDENKDLVCDVCQEKLTCTNHEDTNLDGKCDICAESIEITCTEHKDSNLDSLCDVCNKDLSPDKPVVTPQDVKVAIVGSSEIKSGQSIKLTVNVTGAEDTSVKWEIAKGSEYVSIDQDGTLTAVEVTGDKVIEVVARSNANTECFGKKTITVLAKPVLTDEMLEPLKNEKISFEGYLNISLYTISIFEKLDSTYTSNVKTMMAGTNWYAEYVNPETGLTNGLYYKKYNDLACQIGVNFMNEEEYFPMLDDYNNEISWFDSGMYNVFPELSASDFTFDEENWRYVYSGDDQSLLKRMLASANPYDFDPTNLALIIEEDTVYGIYSLSAPDYTIAQGYKAIQELYVAINYGDTVEVPTINKYSHEEIHDELAVAIENMHNLTSYTLDYHEMTASVYSSEIVESGFVEYVTEDNCYFKPYDIKYDGYGKPYNTFIENDTYGYKKINDNLYNTYFNNGDGTFGATRAYEKDFVNAKPSFAFAPEIYRSYYVDENDGSTTYYVDDLMCGVATTYYYGVGNDIQLYGIFATRGYTSNTESFTPYVVVKDGYIVEACFYYNIGYMYGVIELKYSDFNETTIDENINFDFEVRNVPTSWSQLTIQVLNDTTEDVEVNALDYLKELFNDENIGEKVPFFGEVLGDTYGLGLTSKYFPNGSQIAKDAVMFYYDVPLDIDYTIESSLNLVENYLLSIGFTRVPEGYYVKDNIHVNPTDTNLDFMIYVW